MEGLSGMGGEGKTDVPVDGNICDFYGLQTKESEGTSILYTEGKTGYLEFLFSQPPKTRPKR